MIIPEYNLSSSYPLNSAVLKHKTYYLEHD